MGKLGKITWMAQANCREADLKLFTSFDPAEVEKAKAYCKDCPVQTPCLLDNFDTPWVAAGMTRYERLLRVWHRIDNIGDSNFAY